MSFAEHFADLVKQIKNEEDPGDGGQNDMETGGGGLPCLQQPLDGQNALHKDGKTGEEEEEDVQKGEQRPFGWKGGKTLYALQRGNEADHLNDLIKDETNKDDADDEQLLAFVAHRGPPFRRVVENASRDSAENGRKPNAGSGSVVDEDDHGIYRNNNEQDGVLHRGGAVIKGDSLHEQYDVAQKTGDLGNDDVAAGDGRGAGFLDAFVSEEGKAGGKRCDACGNADLQRREHRLFGTGQHGEISGVHRWYKSNQNEKLKQDQHDEDETGAEEMFTVGRHGDLPF